MHSSRKKDKCEKKARCTEGTTCEITGEAEETGGDVVMNARVERKTNAKESEAEALRGP